MRTSMPSVRVLALAVVILLSACSSGGRTEAGPTRPATSVPTTTTAVTTTTLPDAADISDVDDISDVGLVPADPASAIAAVPAGHDLSFETKAVDVDEVGKHNASVVAPVGWLYVNDSNPSFTDIEDIDGTSYDIDYGCDNDCAPKDWEPVVRKELGVIDYFGSDHADTVERPVHGSRGVVLTSAADHAMLLVRWAPDADAYFTCSAELDAAHADLLAAFTAACEAARPKWIAIA